MAEYYPQQDPNQVSYQTQPIKSDEIYATMLQEDRVKNIIAQTSPDNQLIEIEWRIKGYKKNLSTGQWEKIDKNAPEPPSLLVSNFITYLSSILNDNTRFTNLSDIEINKLMKLVIEFITDDISARSEEYHLEKSYTERTRIAQIVLNQTFIVLKRSQNGMESRRIWNALNMSESFTTPTAPQKGWLDELKFWKKK